MGCTVSGLFKQWPLVSCIHSLYYWIYIPGPLGKIEESCENRNSFVLIQALLLGVLDMECGAVIISAVHVFFKYCFEMIYRQDSNRSYRTSVFIHLCPILTSNLDIGNVIRAVAAG